MKMNFDDWMLSKDARYAPTDDTVTLRRLRECWNAAVEYGRGSPVRSTEVTDAMALAFHSALTDGSIGQGEIDELKVGLRAALAAAPTQPVQDDRKEGWQPIETAPKDGTRIAVCGAAGNVWFDVRWEKRSRAGERWTSFLGPVQFDPTHWMPLPKAPEMDGK